MSEENGRRSFHYSAYGLNIASDICLSDLRPSGSGGDITIRVRKMDDDFLNTELSDAAVFDRTGCEVRVSETAFCYRWRDIGTALVRNGNEVLIDPRIGVDEEEFSPFVTGALLAILLSQRGCLVLHASAVVINGEAVVFLGDKGSGKSTLAAYLERRGHVFVTDDLVPVVVGSEKIKIAPGFPRIKLWADSVEALDLDWSALPRISRFIEKRAYRCHGTIATEPVELGRIYVLDEDPDIRTVKLAPVEAFIELTRHTYLGRYLPAIGQSARNFQQCQAMVSAVPVFSLKRPHDHRLLPDLAAEIERYSS